MQLLHLEPAFYSWRLWPWMYVHPCIIVCACVLFGFGFHLDFVRCFALFCVFLETTKGGEIGAVVAQKRSQAGLLKKKGRRRSWWAGTDEEAIVMQMVEPGRPSGKER
jgi:hypothetical protein